MRCSCARARASTERMIAREPGPQAYRRHPASVKVSQRRQPGRSCRSPLAGSCSAWPTGALAAVARARRNPPLSTGGLRKDRRRRTPRLAEHSAPEPLSAKGGQAGLPAKAHPTTPVGLRLAMPALRSAESWVLRVGDRRLRGRSAAPVAWCSGWGAQAAQPRPSPGTDPRRAAATRL